PNPSTVGQTVTLTATVTSAAGVPTGTVTFRDGATVLNTATLVNGSATFQTAALAAGSHPLTATYNGSAAFAASTSPTVIQVVNPANNGGAPGPINRAERGVKIGELRGEGATSRPGNGSFAASVEIHNGPASGLTCPGALIGTTAVSAADGSWRFRGNTNLAVTTVCVRSTGGGVASRAVQQR